MTRPHLWIRAEARPTEQRVPIVPADARQLIDDGFTVTVEESPTRVIPLAEYVEAGCQVAPQGSWVDAPEGAVVVGIKELPEDPDDLAHTHVFFAHAYKGQEGADAVLDRAGQPIEFVSFDVQGVPSGSAALGELPFVAMPDGYGIINKPSIRAFARFPVRMGEGLHWVEGATWAGRLGIARERRRDKEFSALELRRNLEAVLEQAGAHRVFEGPLQRELYYGSLEQEIGQGFIDGVNLDADIPTSVYVIRQPDRTVWVQLSIGARQAAMVVIDAQPFEQSAHWGDAFPWLSTPAGYGGGSKQRDFDMYPFWNGTDFEEVEGKAFIARVNGGRGKHSMHEVRRNLQAMMDEAGATLVFEGRIPKQASERYGSDLKSSFSDGTGHSWHDYDSMVYRVDLPDGRQVWVHARLEYTGAGWVVVEREALVQTAALLPASELKSQLDSAGKVALQVNFATDRTEILPESQPQIAQVLALLQQDPSLQLSVEGHTDNTGGADHNRSLSQARAASVVAALTAQGIDAARLSAAGFGADRPVADNGSDDGKARNRRVELVKRG